MSYRLSPSTIPRNRGNATGKFFNDFGDATPKRELASRSCDRLADEFPQPFSRWMLMSPIWMSEGKKSWC